MVSGAGRLTAARNLGLEYVPAIRAEQLTEAQVRAFSIVDNRLQEMSDFDSDALNSMLRSLYDENVVLSEWFDDSVFGYSREKFDSTFQAAAVDANAKDIQPGTYRTESKGLGCYWARLRDLSGSLDSIIDNNFAMEGQEYVEVSPSDYAFESVSCGRWELVGR